ncbi:hypothetical protein AHMF7605_03825 [Adhaeribacter arboris]|uniref:Rhamnogalacturonase A/B/Epimerase-like pectate lyase domain-containing protein n=1 Tax=Adhaeribacter arboris TaxID=2072846 RepID=A0A2T2YNT0_9BACT|nr:glycosyl hydrolase family 28-related protein [Adhaeribacter arboris]PSR57162.1 hypothetical protein AHMF7605_03825 [Adhaeribacter arboris]
MQRPKWKNLNYCFWFLFLLAGFPVRANTYSVLDFGAVADAKTQNTKAIQKAIDKCAETGGIVFFPKGTFLSGTIYLKSNILLHLSPMAVLKGSALPQDYLFTGLRILSAARQKHLFSECRLSVAKPR